MSATRDAVLFSGGYSHPFTETSPLLAQLAMAAGWTVRLETDLDAAIAALDTAQLLIVNALYWSMTQHEKYAPDRDMWAAEISQPHIAALDRFVCKGGGLLVIHTGTICWDSQPLWRMIMGGGWQWGVSHHPPLGPVTVAMTATGRAFSPQTSDFLIIDEIYHNLDVAADCDVLATATIAEGPQPVVWARKYGDGRVCVDALGHDARSLSMPDHGRLLGSMLQWLKEGSQHAPH